MPDKNWWIIDIADWGSKALHGTEAEAEEWRAAKAGWEGCVGAKRLADPDHQGDCALVAEETDHA